MKKPTTIDWARLAAYIDGEGCISLARHRNVYMAVRVTIFNTDKRLIEWLGEHFGGHVVVRRSKNIRHKTGYGWCVSSKAAAYVIRNCHPYLILKKEQANVALDFISTISNAISNNADLVHERRNIRDNMLSEMHRLNCKGNKVA